MYTVINGNSNNTVCISPHYIQEPSGLFTMHCFVKHVFVSLQETNKNQILFLHENINKTISNNVNIYHLFHWQSSEMPCKTIY